MSLSSRIAVLSLVCILQPALAGAQLIISEFRLRGPSGSTDEFIEIYNNTNTSHTVAAISGTGYGIAASDGTTRCMIPNGTIIPARGHYLCTNSSLYSLGGYPAGNGTTAIGDATFTTDIPDNAGIALFNNNSGGGSYSLANRFDAVGSTAEANSIYKEGVGYNALTPFSIDYSFTRRPAGGCTGAGGGNCGSALLAAGTAGPTSAHLQDSGINIDDFTFVDTNGTSAGAGQRLGAPGPENLSSPIARDGSDVLSSRLDSCRSVQASPNVVRNFTSDPGNNSTFGTLDIRRTFTNNSGVALTRLRFRILDITTFPSPSGVADLRPRTSPDIVESVDRAPCGSALSTVLVHGTTLEQPPSQINGSGFNGSLSAGTVTLGTPLVNGASVDVRFLLGIQQTGVARFCVATETLPATGSQIFCYLDSTDNILKTFANPAAILVPGTGTSGPAAAYPSNITVAGVGTVAKVTVTLKQASHTFPDDIDVLLVGPTGAKFILLSDSTGSADWVGQTYTFDTFAATSFPDGTAAPSGSYQPANHGTGDTFAAPAPAGPYLNPAPAGASTLAAFNGLNPNGTWSLYITDDEGGDVGTIAGGWELTFTTTELMPATTSDFTGDGAAEPAVYRPSTRTWHVNGEAAVQFGLATDVLVAGDYNGDGTIDRAVYRPSNGMWFVQGQGSAQFGLPGDIPVPGDYNGDGRTDRAVYRRSNGTWFIQNEPPVQWGLPGDIPVPGDYNVDLMTDIAVYRPSTGAWFVLGQADVQFGLPGDIPVPADYNGGGTDRAVYRPSTGTWFVHNGPTIQWGLAGDIPVPSDFDGDNEADLAVYRPSNGTWYTKTSSSNYMSSTQVQFGLPGDIPIPNSPVAYVLALRSTLATQSRVSDFEGDRVSDLTVYRPSNATWFTLRSSSDFVVSASVQWGLSGDVPVPHDYDGDGQTDFAVFRPSTREWHFLRSSSGNTASTTIVWGLSTDVPVPGDYDGDGFADPAVFRPSTRDWFILRSSSNYTVFQQVQWGLSGDVPLTGTDFDGDAISDLTVYRPSTGTWFTTFSSSGYVTSAERQWGLGGDVPVPGEYDGDGRTDHAVYRPSNGTWFVLHSSTNQTTNSAQQWGLSGDITVPGDFDGDRKTDVAIWRPSNATWFFLLSSTNNAVFDQVQFGLSSDIPILKRP